MFLRKIGWLLVCVLFSSCSSSHNIEPHHRSHEYEEITHLMVDWHNLFNQNPTHYYFYCYSRHCGSCHTIKDQVIEYALSDKIPFYFCESGYTIFPEGDPIETLNKSTIDDVFIVGTPTLLEVKNKLIANNVVGSRNIIEIIK